MNKVNFLVLIPLFLATLRTPSEEIREGRDHPEGTLRRDQGKPENQLFNFAWSLLTYKKCYSSSNIDCKVDVWNTYIKKLICVEILSLLSCDNFTLNDSCKQEFLKGTWCSTCGRLIVSSLEGWDQTLHTFQQKLA